MNAWELVIVKDVVLVRSETLSTINPTVLLHPTTIKTIADLINALSVRNSEAAPPAVSDVFDWGRKETSS